MRYVGGVGLATKARLPERVAIRDRIVMITETTAREQFVSDYLLVAENDYKTYKFYTNFVNCLGVEALANHIQNDFEGFVDDLADEQVRKGNEFQALLLRQLLVGFGSDSFYQIAKRFKVED